MAESSSGHPSSSDVPSTSTAHLSSLLRQREHDLDIAAQIGQSLLERNNELQNRNEFLEESLAQSSEQAKQLRYELHRRVELLRYFSIDDDEFGTEGDSSTLCRQVERLRRENLRLTAESNVLKKDLEGKESEQSRAMLEIESQLVAVSTQAAKLQAAISKKNEECTSHGENISRLIEEVNKRSAREKDLTEEKDSLVEKLELAVERESELSHQMGAMQNLYAELKSMFNDAEEELRTYRKKPSPYRTPSVDSLYDSLASELETSDSGGWTPRGKREVAPRSLFTSPPIEISKDDSTPTNNLSLQQELSSLPSVPSIEPAPTTPQVERIEDSPPPDPKESEVVPVKPIETVTASEPVEDVVPVEPVETVTESEPVEDVVPPVEEKKEEREVSHVEVVERSLLFSYDSQLSLVLPTKDKNLPEYIEEPESRPRSRSSSSHSLSDYEAPSLGEPGVPGTRDLRASIKKDVRRQVRAPSPARPLERDFAAWRARKGLRPSSFFPSPQSIEGGSNMSPYLVGDARSVLPWRMCTTVGLQGVRNMNGGGILTRAELPSFGPSPSSSPVHSTVNGLTSISLSSFMPSGGIVLRRPFL